jgi:hypothetical protein
MATVDESTSAEGGAGTLLAGLRTLSLNEAIPFTQYIRYVLPLDGYVFWLRTKQCDIQGSMHISADKRQLEDETISISRVLFTTGSEVQEFNTIGPDAIWIGEAGGLKFAFSQRGPYYRTANLFHYSGDAVYPAMQSQLVDVGAQLSPDTLVVSNSLPAWLQLKSYDPCWLQIPNPCVTLYPSFAVPANLRPPYGSVHIDPAQTKAISAFPMLGHTHTSQHQLVTDRVRITLYGLTNEQAMDFVSLVNQFSEDTNIIGMMDIAAMRDEKRTQAELGILAMKKTIEYSVSYLQGAVRNVARALIEHASATILPQPNGVP